MRVERVAAAGSVVSGLLASACCIGPLVFTLLGISGAASAQRFEPFRPYLLVVTYALLSAAFYFTYGRQVACGPNAACEMSRTNRIGKLMLWITTLIVVLATAFPLYAQYLPF
jgi:mercuric ion transport protein